MKTWDLVGKLIQSKEAKLYNVNTNLMAVSCSKGKSRPAYVKFSISDADAQKLMQPIQPNGAQVFFIMADIQVVNRILDEEKERLKNVR